MQPQRADLDRMKAIALGLLAAAAAVYVLASALEKQHPAWGYVAAFSEAAMVGAIADWFAVVALFRHPLGLPIPHTAIIPENKDRIGTNLASFIVGNFLSTEQVLAKLQAFDPARRLADWLADEGHAQKVALHLGSVLRYAVGALDDERVRHFFGAAVIGELRKLDAATLGSQVLDVLTVDRRHQGVLDALLRKLASVLDNEALREQIAEVIASEVKYLKIVGLDHAAGRYATNKLVSGVTRLVGEMAEDAAHPLRLEFDDFVAGFVVRLKDDEGLRAQVEKVKHDLLESPALGRYLQDVWGDVLGWVQRDLASDDSTLKARTADSLRKVGERLQADAAMQSWINEQILDEAPRLIERYREDIRRYIVARVSEWNTEDMTEELERNIGRDLQFIRINGTLVGGMVGLVIHAVTQLARGA